MFRRLLYRLPFLALCLCLAGCGSDPTSQLLAQLRSPEAEARQAAVRGLDQQTNWDSRVITALTDLVADNDAEVQRLSMNALGKCGPSAESSVPALTKALTNPEHSTRLAAALAIQKIDPKNPNFAPVLVEAMRTGDGRIFLDVGAMAQSGAWAVPTLLELLGHKTPQVRALAAQTLGQIGPAAHDASKPLKAAMRDSNPAVQRAAQIALTQIQPPPIKPAK
ncbi:MAG TPA: HEAT repeat domain-containing protein [Pirellulales bacterium]|jgi:HEAT repeat protein|nr:HEAT repeat domain-containing protein [Pirellulales bacterium]